MYVLRLFFKYVGDSDINIILAQDLAQVQHLYLFQGTGTWRGLSRKDYYMFLP